MPTADIVVAMTVKSELMARPVDCPRCWVRAERKSRKGIEIDICPKCGGIWLDTKELKKLISNPTLHRHLTKYVGVESKSKLLCPRCGGLMNLERADEIEVDVCLTCKGIWLDRGELEALDAKKKRFPKHDPAREATLKSKKKMTILDKLVDFFYYS
jgi:Zn-finger nucleic acid-binding protein